MSLSDEVDEIVRYRFIKEHEGRFSVVSLCRVLQVSRIGYAAWMKRSPSRRTQEENELLIPIQAAFQTSHGTYGSPRIHQELRAHEVACSRNRVARIMGELKIMRKYQVTARSLRRSVKTTDSSHGLPVAANLLKQQFRVEKPNTCWSADITYLWTGEGWLYLAVVMDLYSRRVVGWSLQDTLDRSLVLNALKSALLQKNPGGG